MTSNRVQKGRLISWRSTTILNQLCSLHEGETYYICSQVCPFKGRSMLKRLLITCMVFWYFHKYRFQQEHFSWTQLIIQVEISWKYPTVFDLQCSRVHFLLLIISFDTFIRTMFMINKTLPTTTGDVSVFFWYISSFFLIQQERSAYPCCLAFLAT